MQSVVYREHWPHSYPQLMGTLDMSSHLETPHAVPHIVP